MRIAVDAMGGDHAPVEIVNGAVQAARKWKSVHLVLVGREDLVKAELKKHRFDGDNITVLHAAEVVEMDDSPTLALRRKKQSSMKLAADLVKSGDCQAFLTAGNTGAMVGFCTLNIGRLKGVIRAGIVTPIPARGGIFAMLDAGANITCTPEQMVQYAVMGSIYMQQVGNVSSPRVGLLNIGTEETKGTPFIKETHKALQAVKDIRYTGYVEGHTVFDGSVDVLLTDGFLGNVVLKISEGLAASLLGLVRDAMTSSIRAQIGAALSRKAFQAVKKSVDVSEYGGAMLLGVDGVAIKCHGRADATAIFNGINVARNAVQSGMNERIAMQLAGSEAGAK